MTNTVDFADLQSIGLARQPTSAVSEDIGYDQYLTLMLAQFENQDPFQPMENGDFLAQIAQFTTASGVGELQESFDSFADRLVGDQALQAAALVGRDVLVNSELARTDTAGQVVEGGLTLEGGSGEVRVDIVDASGQQVRSLELGVRTTGDADWSWDGRLDDGTLAPPGIYEFRATVQRGRDVESVGTLVRSPVGSVSLDPSGAGVTINSALLGSVSLADVRQVF